MKLQEYHTQRELHVFAYNRIACMLIKIQR